MKVNICGIPYNIVFCEDKFDSDLHFGSVDYKTCEIRINKDLTEQGKKETIIHEILHAIFIHIGRQNEANDEMLVQSLANAIYQTFDVKVTEND